MTTALAEWDVGASHSNYSDSPRKGRRRRVLVVGAGVSGVAAAKTFLHAAPHAAPLPQSQLLVLEQNDSLGGVWARGRAYPGLASNGPRGLYGLAGHELWDPPTRPISRLVLAEEISGHLESYAKKFGVLPRVVFGTRVDSIVPCFPCGEKPPVWHVSYSSPDRQGTIEVDFVVVATGIFSIPRLALDGIKGTEHAELLDSSVPQTTAQPKPKTLIIHGSHLSQPEIHSRVLSAKGRILIVGYGKSALDISTHLALLRPDVSIVFREAHWFWPFHSYDMATRKSWEGLKPWYEHRSWTARWLFETRWGEQRLEESRKRYEGVLRRVYGLKDGDPLLPTESSRYASAGGLCPVDFFPLIRKNRLGAHKGTISALLPPKNDESFPSVVLDPLHPECPAGLDNVAVIIMATGWSQASFPFFPTELSENLGLPTKTSEMRLYRRILPPPSSWPHRNIAFNGMFNVPVNSVAMEVAAHWIHEVFLGNDTARDPNDAAWNAEIGAAMPLPSDTQILHRIQIFEDWMRTQYIDPARPKRKETKRVHASDTFMNWISYCDDLCKDMGVRTNRKRSAKEDWEGVHTADDWGTLGEERGVARRARGRWGPWFGSLKARL